MSIKIISLGWGIQSWALAAMSALGHLPKVDFAIHADTTFERRETYEFARKWTPWLQEHGIVVVVVVGKRNRQIVDDWGGVFIPAFTTYEHGDSSGMLRRQCTYDWKIAPIRRWLSEELRRRGLKKEPSIVEQQLGITLDEIQRTKSSRVKYIINCFPFLETIQPAMKRSAVIQWLHDHDLPVPIKSSCVFCPYHDRATWSDIKQSDNGDWSKALKIDRAIRHKRPGYLAYLTPDRKPLDECDFRSNEERSGQLGLWSDVECEGMCFL
jgi:hypothetical protein